MCSDIFFNLASWFPGNVPIKPHFITQWGKVSSSLPPGWNRVNRSSKNWLGEACRPPAPCSPCPQDPTALQKQPPHTLLLRTGGALSGVGWRCHTIFKKDIYLFLTAINLKNYSFFVVEWTKTGQLGIRYNQVQFCIQFRVKWQFRRTVMQC